MTQLGDLSGRGWRNVERLLALSVLLGLGVLAVIALGARRSPPRPSTARRALGFALVAVPLPLAVALHLFVWPASALDRIAFVVAVAAFGAGALLVLPGDEEDDQQDDRTDDPDPAPWWPDFERDFRAYARAYARSSRVPTP
jgi:hypothetical protein